MSTHIARKRFGQNFLQDQNVIANIVRAIAPSDQDCLIEIGPGLAALTEPLLERLTHMHVVELDRDLVTRLKKRFSPERLTIHSADALEFDFLSVDATGKTQRKVVGNLPYNISSPLLFHLAQFAPHIDVQVFMLQKEVIERMVAQPATAAYGRLSVMLQWRYEMDNFLFVPPEAFDPPPRVDSAVVSMLPRAQPAALHPPLLEELVQVAFSQRRKILRNTLGRWLEEKGFSGDFDVQRRAEEVPVAEFVALAQSVSAA